MKKIIISLMCVANVTCLAMNEKTRFRDIPRLLSRHVAAQERLADANELSTLSSALVACIAIEEHNRSYSTRRKFDVPDCYEINKRWYDQVKKNQNNS